MKKNRIVLMSVMLAVLALHACKIPTSVEIKTDNLKISPPVKTGAADIGGMLSTTLKDSFPKDFELYDMINYRDDTGKSVQAFLVNYKMELMSSFNPDDYLGGINGKLDEMNNLADAGSMPTIQETINIPALVPAPLNATTTVDLSTLLGEINTSMNSSLKQSIPLLQLATVGNGTTIDTLAVSPIDIFDFSGSDFETLTFFDGDIVLTLTLTASNGGTPNGIEIKLDGVGLTEKDKPNSNSIKDGTPNPVTLNQTNATATVTIDLASKTINTDANKKPTFRLGTVTDNSTASRGTSFKLGISVAVQNLKIKGATGLKNISPIDINIPASLSDIDLGTMPPEFFHAEIGQGQLTIDGGLPGKDPNNLNASWFEGFDPTYQIYIKQDEHTSTVDRRTYKYNGLTYDLANPNATAWNIVSSTTSMQGKHLNPEDIKILTATGPQQSKIIITPPAGASFMLSDNDASSGNIDIDIDITMNIDKLAKVHWNMKDAIPNPNIPPIDLTGASQFVKTIWFDPYDKDTNGTLLSGVELNLNFTSFPLQDFVMELTCRDPNFKLEPIHQDSELEVGDNIYRNKLRTELKLKDNAGNPKKLEFDVDLKPKNGPVVEIENLTPGVPLAIDGKVTFTQQWSEAEVDIKEALQESGKDTGIFGGSFPKAGDPPVDLSSMGKYLDGFTFSGIEAKLFLQGPKGLMEAMEPTLTFQASYKDKNNTTQEVDLLELGEVELKHHVYETLPPLPPKNAEDKLVYENAALPPDGIELSDEFGDLLGGNPKDLSFEYNMGLPPFIIVTPETFGTVDNSGSDSGIHARVLILMPLILEVKADQGAKLDLKEMFKTEGNANTKADLFGRKKDSKTGKPEGSIFNDVDINSLKMSLEFDAELFSGGVLKIDEADNLFANGIPLSGKTINLVAGGPEMKIIQENMIYPHVRIEFLKGAKLKIPRNLVPVRLDITASGSYTMDLPWKTK